MGAMYANEVSKSALGCMQMRCSTPAAGEGSWGWGNGGGSRPPSAPVLLLFRQQLMIQLQKENGTSFFFNVVEDFHFDDVEFNWDRSFFFPFPLGR